MKSYLLLLLSLFCAVLYGQKSDIPKLKFYDKADNTNEYYALLGLMDKNAIIVTPQILPYRNKIQSFLVILTDGSVHKYAMKALDNTSQKKSKPDIRNKEITGEERLCFFSLLNKINMLRMFKSNDIEAYNYWKDLNKNSPDSVVVLDGRTYDIRIFKNWNTTVYSTSNPHYYIKAERPGYKLKQEFLTIFEALDFGNELFETDTQN